MPRRTIGFVVFAFLISLGCIRLGFWQLARLGERRARNAVVEARIAAAPASFDSLPRDSSARYRRTRIPGRFDYDNEFALTGRPRGGSPGVYLLTPLLVANTDTAVLVVRGWVYAADSKSVDLDQWREADSTTIDGFADMFTLAAGPVSVVDFPRGIRVADYDSLGTRLPYPIDPIMVVETGDSTQAANRPARLTLPALGDGPHKSYALQWFAFAAIAWVGIAAVVRRPKRTA
ncbi:MAG: hypothetical protein MNPFHGCM_02423 [Gemmatimonadaceae bacterium]|nr:hypothetical protein [Gemmatimonadaceae bacterium]